MRGCIRDAQTEKHCFNWLLQLEDALQRSIKLKEIVLSESELFLILEESFLKDCHKAANNFIVSFEIDLLVNITVSW
jgi:hypothetical protein